MTKFEEPEQARRDRSVLRIDLVRHGRVAERWRGRIYGDLDVELSDAGREQSRRVASIFRGVPLDGVLSSGLQRSLFGAREIAREASLDAESVEVDARFRELHRGAWAGFGETEVEHSEVGGWRRWESSEGLMVPPEGESHSQLRRRVCTALDDWARQRPAQHWALVAHKWVLRVALAEALGLDDARLTRLEVPTSGVLSLLWPVGRTPMGESSGNKRVGEIHVLGLGSTILPSE